MIQINNKTMISAQVQHALRNDTTLGSGNFLDRCHALNPNRNIDFIFLEKSVRLPDGSTYHAFSLDTLIEARQCVASWYSHLGVKSGDIVTIIVSDGIAPFLHYIALTSLGAAASIINPRMAPDMARAYIQNNGFDLIVMDDETLETTGILKALESDDEVGAPLECDVINYSQASEKNLGELPGWWPYDHQDTTLVMLSHTSGTTGVSKAVRFEHRQFFMGKRARIGQFAESPDERFLSVLPQSHSSAISHLETAVMQGVPTLVMSHAVGEEVRNAIKTFKPTMVAGFPQTYASLVQDGVELNEFSSVRRWFSMGDAAHGDHIRRILMGAPSSRFIDSFGSSELGMALFRKVSFYDDVAPSRCVGRPVEIAVAKVIDANTGEELEAGETGYLAVRSPTITSGYWNNPDVTARAWCNGYFLTGDVGFQRDGDFYLIDRAVDVIESDSGSIYTLLLEEEAQQIEGVCDVSVVGVTSASAGQGQIFALVLPDKQCPHSADVLGEMVLQTLHKAAKAKGVKLADQDITVAVANDISSFPLGATGKVLKRRLRESYAGVLKTLENNHTEAGDFLYMTNGMTKRPASRMQAQA